MAMEKDKVFPRKALFKFLEDEKSLEEGRGVSDEDILKACRKHLQEKGYIPSEWRDYVKANIIVALKKK